MVVWPEGMEDFARYLMQVRGRSSNTALAYTRDVAAFCAWCEPRSIDPRQSISPSRCSMYIMSRIGLGAKSGEPELSQRSAARAVSALQAWGRYLAFSGELDSGSLQRLQVPKYARALPVYYKPEEMLLLTRSWDGESSPLALRNAALLRLLYSSGLRVSECAGLTLGSFDESSRFVRVLGKGGKERLAPYGEVAAKALLDYLAAGRPRLVGPDSAQSLWLTARGKRLGVRAMQVMVLNSAKRAGLAKKVTPHKLRHACATHMLEGGADVRLLQELLGHRDLQTTQVYTQVSRQHLLEAYDKTHPRA